MTVTPTVEKVGISVSRSRNSWAFLHEQQTANHQPPTTNHRPPPHRSEAGRSCLGDQWHRRPPPGWHRQRVPQHGRLHHLVYLCYHGPQNQNPKRLLRSTLVSFAPSPSSEHQPHPAAVKITQRMVLAVVLLVASQTVPPSSLRRPRCELRLARHLA